MRFFAGVVVFLAATCAGLSAQTRDIAPGASGVDFRTGVEKDTFLLVNQYRTAHDLPALTWDDAIAKVARAHSKDMATGAVDFGHDGFRDRINHLRTVMTGFGGAGENVLMSSDLTSVAKTAVGLWLKSPHHLENICGDYNYSGLGVWQDKDGVIYFTQIFMKFSPAKEEAAAPAPAVPFGLLAPPNTRVRP